MSSALSKLYNGSLGLLTDFYQLTMAYGYWKSGMQEAEAVFNLSFRQSPFHGGYAVCAGLGTVIDYLQDWNFTEDDISYLKTLKDNAGEVLFPAEFLQYLTDLRFTCDIDAITEGTVVFPHEPLIRIKGPLLQCQLLETALLNMINFQTLIATKAARVCHAAKGDAVLEFGLRRSQGFDGGLSASRAAYIGGCASTSNVLAGKLFGIPVSGTHAHSWIMAFPTELEAFKTYAKVLPRNCVFLVDTYNTLEGVKNAIEVGHMLKQQGYKMLGIRLDSGDLAYLSVEARKLLDEAGFADAMIVASNGLSEQVIASLKEQGAKINVWGVGTKLMTAYEQPALDAAYKLSAIRHPGAKWEYKLKLSEQMIKTSIPGILAVRRFYQKNMPMADAIYDEQIGMPAECVMLDPNDITRRRTIPIGTRYIDLLEPIFRAGKLVYSTPALAELRQKTINELAQLYVGVRRFLNPHVYPVGLEQQLQELRTDLIFKARRGGRSNKALIIIDLQNDFMPGGSLAVRGGQDVIPLVNTLQQYFDLVVATQDWHPADHGSFAAMHAGHKIGEHVTLAGLEQILWPTHCVQNSKGAELVADLDTQRINKIFHKGTSPQIDSYSAFFDNAHRRSTGLDDYLKKKGIEEVYFVGVATDFCVKYSVLDACMLGFKTYVIEDGCRAVNLQPNDNATALEEMQKAGAIIIQSKDVLKM